MSTTAVRRRAGRLVQIPDDSIAVEGELVVPDHALGVVAFAHGSGSSRLSPRNNYVAWELNEGHLGTLVMDLLTEEEDRDYGHRFDIDLLTERLIAATWWLKQQPKTKHLPVAYFGASTGAAAALKAAAVLGHEISAVVSRGGRPDLAQPELEKVLSPTLLIVGGNDHVVIQLNRDAFEKLSCVKRLQIVPGATHLFEEPGALQTVAQAARSWFTGHLADRRDRCL